MIFIQPCSLSFLAKGSFQLLKYGIELRKNRDEINELAFDLKKLSEHHAYRCTYFLQIPASCSRSVLSGSRGLMFIEHATTLRILGA